MNLINKRLLAQKIESFEFPTGEKQVLSKKLINGWQKALKDSDLEKTKEKTVQGKFLNTFFEEILGYTDVTIGQNEWTLIQHPRIENDSMEPDGSLGWFTKDQKLTRAVIELKDAKTPLDKKQLSRVGKYTPIEQAYLYATKYEGCNWIIVSNFKEIRLYNKQKTQEYYEKFDVLDLNNESEFKRFYYLFSKENFLSKDKESTIDILAKDTTVEEQNITKKFYSEFKQIRLDLLNHLVNHNPTLSKDVLLEKTQKLLDRFIFTLVCEDTSSLLPLNIVKDTYERAINSFSPTDERVWTEFKGLFLAIDKGNSRVKPPINAYNGGLFAFDNVLDNLKIKDDIWEQLIELAKYDFETDLNVNILGHIFEQSISDLESIKETITLGLENGGSLLTEDGNKIEIGSKETTKEKVGKRKKDGIFYTPEYITRYIVENTVGKYLEEHPDKLETIKVLDPACGSGAFLNQAHSFLFKEHRNRYEAKINEKLERKENLTLFDYNPAEADRSILLNNLYGVDLNIESVDITKLALWLKTARRTEPLQSLDKNIKCGNSLIDDATIAGKHAFTWKNEFKDILESGGFDVIIGNPPYVFGREKFSEIEKTYYSQAYNSFEYQTNLFILFIEQAIRLLKSQGYLGFIIPNSLLKISSAKKLRKYLFEHGAVKNIINLYGVTFEDASVETVILIFQKNVEQSDVKILNVYEENDITLQKYKIVDGIKWKQNINSDFDVFININDEKILQKMHTHTHHLEVSFDVKAGLQAYEKGKGIPIQTAEDVINRPYDFQTKVDENTYPYLDGVNIVRYYQNGYAYWLRYGEQLAAPRTFDIFERPRLLVREITSNFPRAIIATYLDEIYLNNRSIINILSPQNDPKSLKALLAVLNSSLISYYFEKTNPKANRKMFPKIILQDLRKFPIPPINDKEKELLAEKVDIMIDLNKKFYKATYEAILFLKEEYSINKISSKLETFYMLGWNEFFQELEKSKIKLNITKKEELHSWFKSKQDSLNGILKQISTIDKQIDLSIFDLYHITPEEKEIVESTES